MDNVWYHGTRRWQEILNAGLSIDAPKVTDPGDFGWGIYLTKSRVLSAIFGRVFRITLDDTNLAYIENPYFLHEDGGGQRFPVTPAEQLFYSEAFNGDGDMLTIKGDLASRIAVAKNIQRVFLANGFAGIKADYGHAETVLFNLSPVVTIELLPE